MVEVLLADNQRLRDEIARRLDRMDTEIRALWETKAEDASHL